MEGLFEKRYYLMNFGCLWTSLVKILIVRKKLFEVLEFKIFSCAGDAQETELSTYRVMGISGVWQSDNLLKESSVSKFILYPRIHTAKTREQFFSEIQRRSALEATI